MRGRGVLPPSARREIGERRYAREEGAFSYKNCTFAELGGEVIGMLHAFPMEEEPEETDEPVSPVLQPYTRLEVPGSHYVSFPEHRGRGLGTRILEMAKQQARDRGCRRVSLLVFERNEGAVELYRRYGFGVVDRVPVVPHEAIRYTG